MAKKILLQPGENPLQMEIEDASINFMPFFVFGLLLVSVGACFAIGVWAMAQAAGGGL